METPSKDQAREYQEEFKCLTKTTGSVALSQEVRVGGEAAEWEAAYLVTSCGD